MNQFLPDYETFKLHYEEDYEVRVAVIKDLESFLENSFSDLPSHLNIKGRVKSFNSFYKKYLRYLKENKSERPKIPDEMGVRIVCPFLEDVAIIEERIRQKMDVIEIERKGKEYNFKEFGYESRHFLINVPEEIGKKYLKKSGGNFAGEIAEIQVRTNLQDAWAEVEHELVYKAKFAPLDLNMRRKLAALNAMLSLADTVFQEFRTYQRQLNIQLKKRRNDFYKRIGDITDAFLIDDLSQKQDDEYITWDTSSNSVDELLLNALYAHNKGLFKDAKIFYSRVLELNPEQEIKSLVYKHRGIASFAQSNYREALEDFVLAAQFDKKSHRIRYYMGIVYSCLREYPESIDAFTESIKINPFQKYCFFRRAQCFYHIDDFSMSLSDCETALSLDNNFAAAKKLKLILLDKLKM
ncbi:MAG: (p)ppGpp synthetase [Spirochaetaceae bacterium]|jgi:putative GTP pyrophosphokinase|nr:(p)ppGpp synthetase [Spirochaetaceae bacterium]